MSSNEQTVTVTIGRGVGNDSQLSVSDWDDFKDAVDDALTVYLNPGAQVVFKGEGQGIWEGVEEVAYTVVVAGWVDRPYYITNGDDTTSSALLLSWLGTLARRFDQDAIAVTFGRTELVG